MLDHQVAFPGELWISRGTFQELQSIVCRHTPDDRWSQVRFTWQDVDIEAGYIHVVSAHKGGLKVRAVPLHPSFKKSLEQWQEEDSDIMAKNGQVEEYLIHFRGKPVTTVKNAWANAKRRAGITRRLRLYDLRHAFATEMLSAGGDLKSTSEMLGHASPSQTVQTYQHVNQVMHRANIDRLPDID